MLLELRDLSLSLQRAGIQVGRTDDHLRPYPHRPGFFVDLAHDGAVVAVRPIDPERLARLCKYECSTGGFRESTPGFNVPPLFRPRQPGDVDAFRKDLTRFRSALAKGKPEAPAERAAAIRALLERCEPNWDDRAGAMQHCLQTAARTLLDRLTGESDTDDASLRPMRELLRRSVELQPAALHAQLAAAARQAIESGSASADASTLVQMLFAKPSVAVLELADSAVLGPANHEDVWAAVNRALLTRTAARRPPNELPSLTGAFGESVVGDADKMPEKRLPRLGNVKLRSMTRKVPCQFRYGLIEAAACPVGPEVTAELAAALEWATHPERERATWADVSESCGFNQPAILIAYPDTLPQLAVQLSAFFADPGNDTVSARRYESFAQTLTERLSGLIRAESRTLVRVFVLAKADPARTKVLCSRQFTAERIMAAAGDWQTAARNLPPILIHQRAAPPDDARWRRPLVPFPGEVVWCLNTAWLRGGTEPRRVSGFDIGSGLTLLLDAGPALQAVTFRALRQVLNNASPFLLAVADRQQRGTPLMLGDRHAKQSLLLPSILGLLLAKLGCLKGAYMQQNFYLIGRMLNLADRLHRNYCQRERDGKLPPQLLGNALMPTALENPVAALARLSERLPLYHRCADRSLRAELAQVEQDMDRQRLPDRCADEDKAQLLLGYLARPDLLASPEPEDSQSQGESL